MYLVVHELRSGNNAGAARAAHESLALAMGFGTAYVTQMVSVIVAVVRRDSLTDAALLLGAVRAQRDRKHLAGTRTEADAEERYGQSLRRILGDDEFEAIAGEDVAEPA
jgi:hypothetical protein